MLSKISVRVLIKTDKPFQIKDSLLWCYWSLWHLYVVYYFCNMDRYVKCYPPPHWRWLSLHRFSASICCTFKETSDGEATQREDKPFCLHHYDTSLLTPQRWLICVHLITSPSTRTAYLKQLLGFCSLGYLWQFLEMLACAWKNQFIKNHALANPRFAEETRRKLWREKLEYL